MAEERLDPTRVNLEEDKNVRRKIHRAQRDGVTLHEVDGEPDEKLQERVNKRLQDWQDGRKGKQVHISGLRPFDDMAHRKYFYTTDKDGEVSGIFIRWEKWGAYVDCYLGLLFGCIGTTSCYPWIPDQVGFGVPWGTRWSHRGKLLYSLSASRLQRLSSQYILSHVINQLGEAGIRKATFGAGATLELRKADNLGGLRFMMLEKAYSGLAKAFPLSGKGDFRQKFGIYQDPVGITFFCSEVRF